MSEIDYSDKVCKPLTAKSMKAALNLEKSMGTDSLPSIRIITRAEYEYIKEMVKVIRLDIS